MYHVPDESEYEITSKLDFVVPLKQVGLITRAVLESIHTFYNPRRIIIISSKVEGDIVRALSPHWNAGVIEFVDEETFFERNYNLSIQQILSQYDATREGDQREPGWWIQQLIKLGAASQIPNISTHYVVWDGDLVPTRRWTLGHRDRNGVVKYYIAVLQAEARSEFNSYQYAMCMKALTGETPRDPQGGGTFVAHHMVFNKHYVNEMLSFMNTFTGSSLPWPLLIMSYSRKFYRFSEYKTYATFMLNRHPGEFHYHPLSDFGEGGLRFRDANRIIEQMLASCPLSKGGLSYSQIVGFARQNMEEFQGPISTAQVPQLTDHCSAPGYIQLDHVYGIAKLGLDPEDLPVFTTTTVESNSASLITPRTSITSASGLALTDLISAASANATAVMADDLTSHTISNTSDTTEATSEGVHASTTGVVHHSAANISNMSSSAEFKVTRLAPVRHKPRAATMTLTDLNIGDHYYKPTSKATSKSSYKLSLPQQDLYQECAPGPSLSPSAKDSKVKYTKNTSKGTQYAASCPSTSYLSGMVSMSVGVSVPVVPMSVYMPECKDTVDCVDSVLVFPVMPLKVVNNVQN